MNFFTPQLYVEVNSAQAEVADRAEKAWEAARAKYEKRLSRIRPRLPRSVVRIADELSLHDAQLLNLARSSDGATLWARQGNSMSVLLYSLKGPLRVERPVDSDVFAVDYVRWLYDEIDSPRQGMYTHAIFFSDGHVVDIAFGEVRLWRFEIHPSGTHEKLEAFDQILPFVRRLSLAKPNRGTHVTIEIPRDEYTDVRRVARVTKRNGGQPESDPYAGVAPMAIPFPDLVSPERAP